MNEPIEQNKGSLQEEASTTNETSGAPMFSHVPVVAQLSVAIGVLVVVFGATYLPEVYGLIVSGKDAETSTPRTVKNQPKVAEGISFEDVTLEAKAAYVWDVRDQRALYNKNADEQLPLASITKLMTALVAHELLGDDAQINITADAVRQDGDSGLYPGEQFDVQNLMDFTLITSSNDGAYALAAAASASIPKSSGNTKTFVDLMNIRAETIGLSRTVFKNSTGLDTSDIESGAYGSARDVTFLTEYILTEYPSLLEHTGIDHTYIANSLGLTHEAANTNESVGETYGILASKTGFTTLAGGNLMVAVDIDLNHPVIITVLGSSYEGRFTDVATLLEATRAATTK